MNLIFNARSAKNTK